MVGYANVYEALYGAVDDLSTHDLAGFGMQIGVLVTMLRSSGCSGKSCDILAGFLSTLELASSDYDACLAQVDATGEELEAAVQNLDAKNWVHGLQMIGRALEDIGQDVGACGIPQLGPSDDYHFYAWSSAARCLVIETK